MSFDDLEAIYTDIDNLAMHKEKYLKQLLDEIISNIELTSRRGWRKSDYLQLIERDGFLCGICGKPLTANNIHVDHRAPIARGGGNELENLQLAHADCNLVKGATIPAEDLLTYIRRKYFSQ